MSDVNAAEIKIFHSGLGKMEDGIVRFVKLLGMWDFLCEHCSMDVLLKWQEADTLAADMY